MKVLAFDCTAQVVTVGLADSARALGRWDAPAARTRGNVLEATIDRALDAVDWTRQDIEGLALVLGPGSLTATRIGWATATGWAAAAGIPVTGWSAVDVQERYWSLRRDGRCLCMIHQRANAFYCYDLPRVDKSAPPTIVTLGEWKPVDRAKTRIVGPGLLGFRDRWRETLRSDSQLASEADTIVGGDLLASWGHEALTKGELLALVESPLEYGLPPDFKKRKAV